MAETEEIMTRHEKNLDQLDKKKKVYLEQKGKAEKLAQDPKAPKFMQVSTFKKSFWNSQRARKFKKVHAKKLVKSNKSKKNS